MTQRVVALVVVGSLALAGCSALHRSDREPRPLVVVLFDVSRSTNRPDIRARYLDAFERVEGWVADQHGTIVGDVIDDDPLAHSTFPIDATFAPCDVFTDNRLTCDARTTEARGAATVEARSILARVPTVGQTDIHDALALAHRVFAAYPDASPRSLVVLSDMVERTSRLSVGRAGFGDDQIEPTLDAFAADGLIADLNGVSVYVVGAGAASGAGQPAERILTIERFWQAYFTRAGASLSTVNYGAALVRFP